MATSEQLLEQALARNNELYALTQPLRTQGVNTLQSVMMGAPASSLPAYAPNRAAIEGQYTTTDRLLQNTLQRGGQLNAERSDLLGKRADAVSGLESSVRQDALNKALSIGWGAAPTSLSTQMSGANMLNTAEAQDAARSAQALQAGTTGIGLLLGLLGGWGK